MGDRIRSRSACRSRSGWHRPPTTAAATATATATVAATAPASTTAAVSAVQTVHVLCQLTIIVRGHPSLCASMLLARVWVPGGGCTRGGVDAAGAGAGGRTRSRNRRGSRGGVGQWPPATAAATATATATVTTAATATATATVPAVQTVRTVSWPTVAVQNCPSMVITIVILTVLIRSLLARTHQNSFIEARDRIPLSGVRKMWGAASSRVVSAAIGRQGGRVRGSLGLASQPVMPGDRKSRK